MMVKRSLAVGLVLLAGAVATPAARAQDAGLSPERVRKAIRDGVEYLRSRQRDGNWEHQWAPGGNEGGVTSLALLALLECGVDPQEDVIVRGLQYLRGLEPRKTYATALQTMVFCKASPKEDQVLIKRNIEWFRRTAKRDAGKRVIGWEYPGQNPVPDNSNSQYAILALREAEVAGIPVGDDVWRDIRDHYTKTQLPSGGWSYYAANPQDERLTMTSAGVCNLIIAGMQLYRNLETIEPSGEIKNCGEFQPNDPLSRGLQRLGELFTVNPSRGGFTYYNLYGLERAGRLSGQRFFTGRDGQPHDWYRAGAEFLIGNQLAEGSWQSNSPLENGGGVISTSFALLFLAKGKTPVLIHKMMHGPLPRGLTGDWNTDRNDVRNLTEFCSKELFKKNGRPVPLTWQAFDASQLDPGRPGSVEEMLQAPIAFINGHLKPDFTDGEKRLLARYVEQGGFLFAEACCGRKEFDAEFRKLVKDLKAYWTDQTERDLAPLSEGHAVWGAAFKVPPGAFKLEGVEFGCKTCIIYAPEDLSCHWEANRFEGPGSERTVLAFRVGANVVAYATGLEPPEDKLTPKPVVGAGNDPLQRNFLQAAQIDYGGPDWQPAPKAMRNLMDHLHRKWNIDVILQTKAVTLADASLPNYKFLYMHGRRAFTIPEPLQKTLRGHLERGGGLLLADACCGSEAFDKAFRAFIEGMFGRPLEPIKPDDPLFGEQVGKAIRTVQGRTQRGKPYEPMAPQFEGIRADPKNPRSPWVVIYSKYDLGCALDKHAATDCLGYSHESALELAAQVVLYALKE
jgi:hypothetical protein